MHSHLVFFWLKEDLSDSQILQFEQGLQSLMDIPLVIQGYYGKPADTHRPVVENSYSYALSLLFADLHDHDRYQTDEAHVAFVNQHQSKWHKVQIFDVVHEAANP